MSNTFIVILWCSFRSRYVIVNKNTKKKRINRNQRISEQSLAEKNELARQTIKIWIIQLYGTDRIGRAGKPHFETQDYMLSFPPGWIQFVDEREQNKKRECGREWLEFRLEDVEHKPWN